MTATTAVSTRRHESPKIARLRLTGLRMRYEPTASTTSLANVSRLAARPRRNRFSDARMFVTVSAVLVQSKGQLREHTPAPGFRSAPGTGAAARHRQGIPRISRTLSTGPGSRGTLPDWRVSGPSWACFRVAGKAGLPVRPRAATATYAQSP